MSNSHSEYLLGMLEAILADCSRRIPGLSKELKRDYQRLSSCVNSRGLRVLTLDLPAVGKEYDYSLHVGRLTLTSSYLTGRRVKGSPIPRLFGGLVMRVFDADGVLRAEPDTVAIQSLRQVCNFAKKWRTSCAEKFTFKEVREFFRIDAAVRRPTLDWREPNFGSDDFNQLHFTDLVKGSSALQSSLFEDEGRLLPSCDPGGAAIYRVLDILQRVADVIGCTLGNFEPDEWRTKHGPGVVSDQKAKGSKYEFLHWPERLESVFPMADFGFPNVGHWADYVRDSEKYLPDSGGWNAIHVRENEGGIALRFNNGDFYSRLIAVPKTQKGPRLIAAEPTANQWCQQSIRDFMYTRAHKSWIRRSIRFDDQTVNQNLARAASVTSAWSTIDLSAASDRMSCWVVERMFRSNKPLLSALHASRTFIIRNSIDKKCSEFSFLNKFSTMGSAVTFPVQSLVFLAVALAVSHARHERSLRVTRKSCERHCRGIAVFGDDIVVPTDIADAVMQLLEHLGFKVNMSKTYTGSSKFRESCGMEAYAGNDVTPCYALTLPKRTAPDSFVSQVATAHNFFARGYYAVTAYIRRTTLMVAPNLELPWVKLGSGIFGWPSPFGFDVGSCKTRFNFDLWRMEYRTRRVTMRPLRLSDRGPSRLFQYFVEAPSPLINWASGVVVKGRTLTRSVWEPLPA